MRAPSSLLSRKQSGNALFLILIAVALFAAIGYAVTQSGRSSGGTDRERARIIAAQTLEYFAMLRTTVNRLILINGCTETEISFEVPDITWYQAGVPHINANANAAGFDNRCHVFHANGGNLYFPKRLVETFGPLVSAAAYINKNFAGTGRTRISGVGTTASDLTATFYGLDPDIPLATEICRQVNKIVGVSVDIPATGYDPWSGGFSGTYVVSQTVAAELTGFEAGCLLRNPGSEGYFIYTVLIPR